MRRSAHLWIGLFLLMIAAQSAEARRFRVIPIPGFGGGGEKIDRVYDLPDEEPFITEGKYYDIGYLISPRGNSYVAYHGDRYRKLSDEDISMFTDVLGIDPTADHRAQNADKIAQAQAERAEENEARIAASDATEPVRLSSMSSGTFGIGLIALLIAVLALFGRKLFGGVFRRAASDEEMVGGEAEGSSDTFDERVARRLAELKSGGGEAPGGPPAPALPPRPAFGRKTS